MGYTHFEVDPDEEYEPSGPTKKKESTSDLSELLEWERKQRAEAQARVLELEKELAELKASTTAERAHLCAELDKARSAAQLADLYRDKALAAQRDQSHRCEELAALLDEARQSRDAALQRLRRAETGAADAARGQKRRMNEALRLTAASLAALRADWVAVRQATADQAQASAQIASQAGAQFARALKLHSEKEAKARREAIAAASEERQRVEEQLAESRAEVRRLKEALEAAGPAAQEVYAQLKKAKGDSKRLQELVDRLRGQRSDAATLEKERDEALAAAAAAAALEKKLRAELEAERGKCAQAQGRAESALEAASKAREEAESLRRDLEQATNALRHLESNASRNSVTVSAEALRALESSARELYVSGGRRIEEFLSALALVEGTVEQLDETGKAVPSSAAVPAAPRRTPQGLTGGMGVAATPSTTEGAAFANGMTSEERSSGHSSLGKVSADRGSDRGPGNEGSGVSESRQSSRLESRGSCASMSSDASSTGGTSAIDRRLRARNQAPTLPQAAALAEAPLAALNVPSGSFGGFAGNGRGRSSHAALAPTAFGSRARVASGDRKVRAADRLPAVASVPSIGGAFSRGGGLDLFGHTSSADALRSGGSNRGRMPF